MYLKRGIVPAFIHLTTLAPSKCFCFIDWIPYIHYVFAEGIVHVILKIIRVVT